MVRRVMITLVAAAGAAGALAVRTRPLNAEDKIYQLTSDYNGNAICTGPCNKGCCTIRVVL